MSILLIIMAICPSKLMGLGICILITISYQYVIAMIVPNTIAMPAMDHQILLSNAQSLVNICSYYIYDRDDKEILNDAFHKAIKINPKMRYKMKEIMGDYYYEEMSVEETIQKVFIHPEDDSKLLKNRNDLDRYFTDNLNKKISNDGPLYRVYYQTYEPNDYETNGLKNPD